MLRGNHTTVSGVDTPSPRLHYVVVLYIYLCTVPGTVVQVRGPSVKGSGKHRPLELPRSIGQLVIESTE